MLRFSSLAKITPPSFTGIYPRERLFNLLDKSLDRPAIWITGPPGSGKTSLVSNYLSIRGHRNLWYQVDEGDADIATFFYYMRLAVPRVTPRRGTPLSLLTPEYLKGILAFTRRYCQNLYKRLNPPFILVFDNYQEVPQDSSFHEVIKAGIGELPRSTHAIFISRADPPPALARLRANEIMKTIGWDDLQLTETESEGIINLRKKTALSSDQLQLLHKKTEGWVAGLILMLEQPKLEDIPLQSLNEYTPQEIIDYFAGEIFQKGDATVQDFLLKTSFLPRMTIKMAEEMSDSRRAGQYLSHMSQNNNFTTCYIQPEPVYQYHPLFREFLLTQAKDVFFPEEIFGLQQHAAALLEKYGMVEDAIKLLRDSENWPNLINLVLKWATFLVENGRMQTLHESISHIPASYLDQYPWLLYWLGICRQPFEPRSSREYLERAFTLFRSRQDSVGTYMAWCEMGIAIQSDESGNHSSLDRWITTLDEIMSDFPSFPSAEIHDRTATVMFIALMMRMPDHPMMEAWENRALTVFRTSTKPKIQAEIGAYLALYHLMSGNFLKAEVEVSVLRGVAESPAAPPIALILGRLAEALYYWRVSQFEECLQTVSSGLETAGITGVHLWDFLLLAQGLSCTLSMGDMEKSREYLEQMAPDMDGPRRLVVCYYRYLASWDAFLRRNFKISLQHAEIALLAALEIGVPYFETLAHLALSIVKYELHIHDEAVGHLDRAMNISARIKNRMLEYMCLLTRSHIALMENDDKCLRECLGRAFACGRDNDYSNFSWWLPDHMARLCSKALEYDIETDYVKKLIKKRGLIPGKTSTGMEKWPWDIKVYTMGKFEILKQGSRLTFTRKTQKKPLELLKLVLTCGGYDVPEEKITGILWPDSDGDSAHRSFTTTLHRLRKLLGTDQCILLQDGKVSLVPRYFWVDYWAFERLLDEENVSDIEDKSACIRKVQNVMSLYQGAFLPGDSDLLWTMTMRDHLRSRFVNFIGKLGQKLEESGDWNVAVELYKKGHEADNLVEEFYRNLMRCYLHLNLKADGLAVYQRCKTLFSVVLGTKPSAATEAVRNLLTRLA